MKKEKHERRVKTREDKKGDRAYLFIVWRLRRMGIHEPGVDYKKIVNEVIKEIEGEGKPVTYVRILHKVLGRLEA